jgi:hypothetical protein
MSACIVCAKVEIFVDEGGMKNTYLRPRKLLGPCFPSSHLIAMFKILHTPLAHVLFRGDLGPQIKEE